MTNEMLEKDETIMNFGFLDINIIENMSLIHIITVLNINFTLIEIEENIM